MANKPHGTLYIGVTSDIIKRVYEHKNDFVDGFTRKYALKSLVYYEVFDEKLEKMNKDKKLEEAKKAISSLAGKMK